MKVWWRIRAWYARVLDSARQHAKKALWIGRRKHRRYGLKRDGPAGAWAGSGAEQRVSISIVWRRVLETAMVVSSVKCSTDETQLGVADASANRRGRWYMQTGGW